MLAKIVKIGSDTVTLKNSSGRFKEISKDEIQFDYKLGDTIEIETNGSEHYYLPYNDGDDFYDEQPAAHKKKSAKIKGIGGVLIVLIVSLILKTVLSIMSLSSYNEVDLDCSAASSSSTISYSTCNNLKTLIGVENFAVVVCVVLLILSIIFIFMKKKAAVNVTIATLAAIAVWNIIDYMIARGIMVDIPLFKSYLSTFDGKAAGFIAGSIIYFAIWTPYLLSSKRVKETLVN